MNDLTKEELQKICNALEVWAGDDPYLFMPDIYVPIYNKIKSLIDNYCEHEWKESVIEYPNYICTLCGIDR